MIELERNVQDQPIQKDFEVHNENLKKVALIPFDHEHYGDYPAISAKRMAVLPLIIGATLLLGISLDVWRVHRLPASVDDLSVKPDASGKNKSLSPEPRTQRHQAKTRGAIQPTESIEKEASQDLSVVRLKSIDRSSSPRLSKSGGPATELPLKSASASAQAKAVRSEPQGSRPLSVQPVSAEGPARNQTPEILAFPVIHDHFMGKCQGTLRVSRKLVTFEPSSSSGHGFEGKPAQISFTNLGNLLEIRFNNKTYRFKSALTIDKADNRSKIETISQHLKKIQAENAPN